MHSIVDELTVQWLLGIIANRDELRGYGRPLSAGTYQ